VAHTLISRFVNHLPYYRQEAINARSNVHTPQAARPWSLWTKPARAQQPRTCGRRYALIKVRGEQWS
jgi:transposase